MHFSDEVEFRWAGNKLFLPGDVNKPVGEVYNTYLTGDMARYYSAPTPSTKKAAGLQPQFLMALELYIDQPKVLSISIDYSYCVLFFHTVYPSTTQHT